MIYVVIGAYKAQEWIERCLESVRRQTMPVKILLGIDGCKETLKAVKKIMRRYDMDVYFYPENKGVYITINTLIAKVPSDGYYLWWGADDMMGEEMVEIMWCHRPCYSYFSAPHILSKRDYLRLGGFMPWRVAADTEFRQRIYKIRPDHKCLPPLWKRGQHKNQLTKQKETGFGSEMRRKHTQYIKDTFRSNSIKIRAVKHTQEVVIKKT